MSKDGGNDGRWTPRKTNGRFPPAPTALGNRQRRDFHIPTAPAVPYGLPRTPESGRSVGRGKVEIENHDSHFSTAPTACGSKEENLFKIKSSETNSFDKKEAQQPVPSLTPPGSSFDENMLGIRSNYLKTGLE